MNRHDGTDEDGLRPAGEEPRAPGRRGVTATAVLWGQRVLYLLTSVLAGWGVYHLFLEEIDDDGRLPWAFLLIWVLSAYVLLPRLTRLLTRLYVPDYFIGRARTADGLLGDPINLAVVGTPARLRAAMLDAGWTAADPLTVRTGWHIVRASLLRRSYPAAPLSPLFAFGCRQALAFEQEVAGSPAQRHHVRFWTCPPGWLLPGGYAVDLLGAATFDRRVGLSLFTLQVTHKIAERTDEERDRVVAALRSAGATVHVVHHFSTGYHARNGGGDAIETDGDLPVVDVWPAPPAQRSGGAPGGG
ncbi:LssY C-terminal domain-containing protein [Kocuria sp. U4B]